jgi:CheY-like chemotaxis protein
MESPKIHRDTADIDPHLLARQLSVPVDEDAPDASIPAIDVIELSPQESVQAWAEAQRGTRALQEKGFFAADHTQRRTRSDAAGDTVKVLVVEDDDLTAEMLEFLLREHGFYVKRAADGRAALTELQRRPLPDVVLLDIMLPGYDGFEVLRSIRSDSALHALPAIMVTSKISDDDVLRGLKEGADGYVFKPFRWETLYGCIRSVCGA